MEQKTRLGVILDIVRESIRHLDMDPVLRALVVENTAHAVYYAEQDSARAAANEKKT